MGFENRIQVFTPNGLCGKPLVRKSLGLDLFPAPAAVFHWDPLGRLAGRRMSDRTARLGPEYCALPDTAPETSATARATSGLRIGIDQARAHVMDWFPKLSGYGPDHQEQLVEEVMSLGHHGWLTLVRA